MSVNQVVAMALVVEVQLVSRGGGTPTEQQFADWARAAWVPATSDAEVVLRVTGDAESRRLNRRYRSQDKPTNVLSFPCDAPPVVPKLLGDLVICAPVVDREAREQGKATEAHWAHMVVHGMLHLQGYDHASDPQAGIMERLETDILTGLGYPPPYQNDESYE